MNGFELSDGTVGLDEGMESHLMVRSSDIMEHGLFYTPQPRPLDLDADRKTGLPHMESLSGHAWDALAPEIPLFDDTLIKRDQEFSRQLAQNSPSMDEASHPMSLTRCNSCSRPIFKLALAKHTKLCTGSPTPPNKNSIGTRNHAEDDMEGNNDDFSSSQATDSTTKPDRKPRSRKKDIVA